MQRSSRQVCLGFICEESQPSLWCPRLWYTPAKGLAFAFCSRVMITNIGRYSSYTTPHNKRQISSILAKSRAIWNRIIVCRKWHTPHHVSSIVWNGWYLELIKSVKISFTAWQNTAGCSYMAQCYGGRMHETAAFSLAWLLGKQLCFLHLQTRHSNHPSRGKFSSRSIISAFDYSTPSFQGCSSKHLQESNKGRRWNLILDVFLRFKSLKWNHLILPSRFQNLENFKKIKK